LKAQKEEEISNCAQSLRDVIRNIAAEIKLGDDSQIASYNQNINRLNSKNQPIQYVKFTEMSFRHACFEKAWVRIFALAFCCSIS
jgi:hypothetical protein